MPIFALSKTNKERDEEIYYMDNSGGDGAVVPRASLRADLLHRGDGEDEERAVQRERLPQSLSGLA